jgi:hypothetical protein
MSDPKPDAPQDEEEVQKARGPNLTLLYGLILLAVLAAIVFAALIVMPFYHRR